MENRAFDFYEIKHGNIEKIYKTTETIFVVREYGVFITLALGQVIMAEYSPSRDPVDVIC